MLRTEQRSEPRITTRITVETVGPTLNISAGGMCVLVSRRLPTDVEVSLAFELTESKTSINCKGIVAWSRASHIDPDLFEMGIRFTEISDGDRREIDNFVDAHLKEEASVDEAAS